MKFISKKISLIFFVTMFVLIVSNVFVYADEGVVLNENDGSWKRYSSYDSNISYINFNQYNRQFYYLYSGSGTATFTFTGTKLRINGLCDGNFVSEYIVTIDGVSSENIVQSNVILEGKTFEITNLSEGAHKVIIKANNPNGGWHFQISSIDIDVKGQLPAGNKIEKLIATPGDSRVILSWDQIIDATGYVIKYGTSSGNYTETITVSADSYNEYIVDNLINDTTYYFVVCPIINNSEGQISNEAVTTPIISAIVLDIEVQKEKIKIGEVVKAGIIIDNVKDIAAEDIIITYDTEKLQYIGHEELDGIKLVYCNESNGELRFILASRGEANIVNDKTVLLNLKFKGIGNGEAIVDITRGRISDGIEMEKDLTSEQCDLVTIIIEGLLDVNNSGEFTLLDLAIDARHLNKDPNLAELTKYNTDIVSDSLIDEKDLLEIGRLLLSNLNYPFNN